LKNIIPLFFKASDELEHVIIKNKEKGLAKDGKKDS
jgi:hypothetical protein